MPEPKSPSTGPCVVEVVAGRAYAWCACGRSGRQPFCDGTHNPREFMPVRYFAEVSGPVAFCGCKLTSTAPVCDRKACKPEAGLSRVQRS